MAFGRVVILIVPRPALRERAAAIIPDRDEPLKTVVAARAVAAVLRFEQDGGALAVGIKDRHVPLNRAVGDEGIRNRDARHFHTGQAVENGKELHVVVRAGGDGHAVGEDHAVRRPHDHFRTPVAVEVIHREVVAVADADGRGAGFDVVMVGAVVAHVHAPEEHAVALVGFDELAALGVVVVVAVHHEIVFAIAIEIADPAELHLVRAVGRGLERHGEILARDRIRR